jgi:hypothetical protein
MGVLPMTLGESISPCHAEIFLWLTERESQSKDNFSTDSIPIGLRRRRTDVEIPATTPTQ